MQNSAGTVKLIPLPFLGHVTRMTTKAFSKQTMAAPRPGPTVTAAHQILGMFCALEKKKRGGKKAARETIALIFDG